MPALMLKIIYAVAAAMGPRIHDDITRRQFESGGEDMPNAFRGIPTLVEHLVHNIVAAKNPVTGKLEFFQMYAALFGFESSVYAFGRWSAFLQAAGRRVGMLLWSMFVDDGNLIDLAEAKGEGQNLVGTLFRLLGAPLAKEKRVLMNVENDFLGIIHDLREQVTRARISFWPRDSLCVKINGFLDQFKQTQICYPGDSSKFRGMQAFCGLGIFGHLGKAAIGPFRQRQYYDCPSRGWGVTDAMNRAIEFYKAIFEERPKRILPLGNRGQRPLVIASDAQVEPGEPPGGGYLIVDPETGARTGAWHAFTETELTLLSTSMADIAAGKQPIARIECCMLPALILEEMDLLRGRDVVWFVDNTAALCGTVKGGSKNATLAKLIAMTWILCFRLNIRIWFEFVDSEANWSDGISRDFDEDIFAKTHEFATRPFVPNLVWLTYNYSEIWKKSIVFQQ